MILKQHTRDVAARYNMPTAARFVALTVTPGVPCKVILPPCSALQLSNAALAAPPGQAFGRCQLECDLATHSFVICSLLTTGVRQAGLDVAITNDPAEAAWFFLNAKGPHAFHVVGRLIQDKAARAVAASSAASAAKPSRSGAPPPRLAPPSATAPAPKRPASCAPAGASAKESASDTIEVLLPSHDERLAFDAPSDADSEEFVEFMQASSAVRKRPSPAGRNGGALGRKGADVRGRGAGARSESGVHVRARGGQ
jgi:hypothetical protein